MAAPVVSVSKRLLGELKDYAKDPHECLEELAPVEGDLLHWTAIMKGVEGTAYEREFLILHLLPFINYSLFAANGFSPPVVLLCLFPAAGGTVICWLLQLHGGGEFLLGRF